MIYSSYEQCYSENILQLIYPNDIINDLSYIKKLLSLNSKELKDKAEDKLIEIGYIMRDIENQSKINLLLNDDNVITPPWITFPNIQRYSIGWRMGGGKDFITYWSLWMESLNRDQLADYLLKYKPLPFEWLDTLFYYTGYEVSTKSGRIKAYDFLVNIGINHLGDYDSWENRVDHLFKTGKDLQS